MRYLDQPHKLFKRTDDTDDDTDNTKHHKGEVSRLAVALGFGVLGKKIGFLIGSIFDAEHVYKFLEKEDNVKFTVWQKIKGIFDGTATDGYTRQQLSGIDLNGLIGGVAKKEGEEKAFNLTEIIGKFAKNSARSHKWGLIVGFAMAIPLFVVGWWRGGKLKNAGELIKRPVHSLKVILGVEADDKPEEQKKESASISSATSEEVSKDSEDARKWREHQDAEDAQKWREYVASRKEDDIKDITPRGSYTDEAVTKSDSAAALG